jgi:hypothetical protein
MENESLKAALSPAVGCLSIERLGRYADGALTPDEQAATAAHLADCLSCQAELGLLRAVTSTAVRAGEEEVVRDGMARLAQRDAASAAVPRAAAPLRRRWLAFGTRSLVAVAAVVVLGVALGTVYVLRTPQAPRLPTDVTTGDEITRSLAVAVRTPVGDQIESPGRFEWLAVERAVRYRVRLLEVDRREVWSTFATALAVDLPPDVRMMIVPGRTMLWDVTAYDAAGMVIAESGTQSFRVLPR